MAKQIYQFGDFRLDHVARALWRGNEKIALTGREFDVLLALVQRPGVPVEREVLIREVWPNVNVADGNLRQHIKALRKKLGNDAAGNAYIVTVSNRGYQFAANVVCVEEGTEPPDSGVPPVQEPEPADTDTAPTGWTAQRSLLVSTVCAVVLICSVVAWNLLPKQAEVLALRQLTLDGRTKGQDLVTDGKQIYFTEFVAGRRVIASLPISGGMTRHLQLPLGFPSLVAISPGGKSLLVFDSVKKVFCELEMGSLTLRPIPIMAGANAGVGAWNPDGVRFALSSGDSLTVFEPWKPAKLLERHFAGVAEFPSWHPLDGRLRFDVMDTKTQATRWWEIAGMDRAAHPLPRMSPNPSERHGVWTSDGRFFVFQAGPGGMTGRSQIWIAEGDPPRSYRLTRDALTWVHPTVVPGSRTVLAFARQSQAQLVRLPASDGDTSSRPLLPDPAYELDYSPDGKWIAYTLFPEHTLWRCGINGGEAKQLTPASMEAHQPHWSPDGARIAFMGKRAGDGKRWRVYVVFSPDGSLDEALPDGDDQGVPTWSADGRSLIFGDLTPVVGFDRAAIHQLNLHTRVLSTITTPIGMWSPRMSPDGRYLAAVSYENKNLYLRDNLQRTWRKCVTMGFIEELVWPLNSSWIQFIGVPRAGERRLFRTSPACEQPREILDLLAYNFVGSTWIGIAPDHSPIGLVSIPDEIYAIDWRIRRILP